LFVALLAAACSGDKNPMMHEQTADQWLEAMRAAGDSGPDSVIEVRSAYLAATTEETRAHHVADTGVASLGGQENQWIIAEALHKLGRYDDASALYSDLLDEPSPRYPRTRLAYRKALADTGIAMSEDVAVDDRDKKSALLDRLVRAEASLTQDAWSHKLEYRVVFLQYLLGRVDLARLAEMAGRIDLSWSPQGEQSRLVHGSTLFMAEESLRAAGRVKEADTIASKLLRFDELYGTNYSSGHHGGHHDHN
jgi:tetratricopeptide (TPR) repeat protein